MIVLSQSDRLNAMRLPTVLWAAFLYVLLTAAAFANTTPSIIVNGCNFAPYAIQLNWIVPETGEHGRVPLAAGECNSMRQSSSQASKNTRLFAEPTDSLSYEYIRYKDWYANFWNELGTSDPQWPSAETDGLVYCVTNSGTSFKASELSQECPNGTQVQLYSAPLNFDESGRADWIMLDFALCGRLTDLNCYNTSLDELAIWAAEMAAALDRLYQYRHPSSGRAGLIPSISGLKLEDRNRLFNEGVEVVSSADATPFGTPIQLQPGDEIVFFNGHKVFGQDINTLFYEAGRAHGYNHMNEVIFRREGTLYSTGLALYFDDYAYREIFAPNGRCREPFIVGSLHALNEFHFYSQSTLTCLLDEFLDPGTVNQAQCRFDRDQFRMAAKQFCPRAAFTGEMVGSLSFIGANFVEKMIPQLSPGLKGKSLYSRAMRAVLREVGEETARTLLTQPPGLNTEAVIDDIVARGKLQGAIGVGFQVAPRVTGALLIPMIYGSYQQL